MTPAAWSSAFDREQLGAAGLGRNAFQWRRLAYVWGGRAPRCRHTLGFGYFSGVFVENFQHHHRELSSPGAVKCLHRFRAGGTLDVVKHVQCDPTADGGLSPHSVHGLLDLAMPTVGPFHGVGGRLQQAIVQEGQRLLQVGGLKLLEDRPQSPEVADGSSRSRAGFESPPR